MIFALVPLLAACAFAQQNLDWPETRREHKPWTRWWWHGSAVDKDTLRTELQRFHDAGLGGVEITPIYGVKGQQARNLPYLSPEWTGMVRYAAEQAAALGMGVDLTPGSGWRIGGPLVTAEHANASVRIRRAPLSGPYRADPAIRPQAVMAYSAAGQVADLTAMPQWTPPAGDWTVYTVETVPSGEKVKRPAPGGEGFTIDTYSGAAFRSFFDAFDHKIAGLPHGSVRAWFHDSFEYTGNWSGAMLDEFQRRRGYDLRRHLPELLGEGDPDRVGRVLSDYRETLSDLLRDNVIAPLAQWSKSHGGVSRNQAHGSPGNLLDLYAACDIPETEIFGRLGGSDSDPLISKFASSAAHVTGKPLTSSESFTWLNEHFTVTLEEIKRAADQLFVSGVNHIVFHGTAYSPPGAAWPGWVFYASTQLNPRNPIWRDLPVVNRYITRAQSVLQSGSPSNDVLLYWPYADIIDNPGPMFQQLAVHSPVWFYQESTGPLAAGLWRQGYSFDYVSDRQLTAEAARRYRAIVVPQTRRMPVETFERLVSLAREGALVIFQKHLPEDVPGLANLERRRARMRQVRNALRFVPGRGGIPEAAVGKGRMLLANDVGRALETAGVPRESLASEGIQFIRRAHEGGYHYFLVNSEDTPFDGWLSFSSPMAGAALMDPMTGAAGLAAMEKGRVRLQLEPGASMVVRTFTAAPPAGAGQWRYLETTPDPIALNGTWRVRFVEGGPELPPAFATSMLDSWTLRGGDAVRFGGSVVYTLAFDDPGVAAEYLLDLGSVRESAAVVFNGRAAGTALMAPFRVRLNGLKPKGNVLEVTVTNLAANRIRDLDRRGVAWRIFEDINFVNIGYRPFDASGWPVRPAGLLGPVHLIPLR